MSLAAVLENSCPALERCWAKAANAIYPFAATGFLLSHQDPFANPVGQRSANLAPLLCRAVIGLPHDSEALSLALEEFVRVRAMQDASPEASLEALFACKDIFRSHLEELGIPPSPEGIRELSAMDKRCDALALRAFGIYTRLREAFFEARVQDLRRRHSQILRLAQRHGLAEPGMEAVETDEPGGDTLS